MQSDESTAQNEGEESAVYILFILHFALCIDILAFLVFLAGLPA